VSFLYPLSVYNSICLDFFWISDNLKILISVPISSVIDTSSTWPLLYAYDCLVAGSGFWSRFIEVTIAKSSFGTWMGYITAQRASLCPLYCWTWESTCGCNCLHVLVWEYGCKFVPSRHMQSATRLKLSLLIYPLHAA
jgi:hypothetical protein